MNYDNEVLEGYYITIYKLLELYRLFAYHVLQGNMMFAYRLHEKIIKVENELKKEKNKWN